MSKRPKWFVIGFALGAFAMAMFRLAKYESLIMGGLVLMMAGLVLFDLGRATDRRYMRLSLYAFACAGFYSGTLFFAAF